jgi:hypothetical protein
MRSKRIADDLQFYRYRLITVDEQALARNHPALGRRASTTGNQGCKTRGELDGSDTDEIMTL